MSMSTNEQARSSDEAPLTAGTIEALPVASLTPPADSHDADEKATPPMAKRMRLSRRSEPDDYEKTKKFVLTAFRGMHDECGIDLWKDLPDKFKDDPDVALLAWNSQCVDEAPPCLSREMIQNEIRKGWVGERREIYWGYEIPADLRKDETFVRANLQYVMEEELVYVRDDHPQLFQDRVFMIQAVKDDLHVWDYLHESLCQDEKFVRELLHANPLVLDVMSRGQLSMFPELVKDSLRLCSKVNSCDIDQYGTIKRRFRHLAENVPRGSWQDREFVLAWFRAGLPYFGEYHPIEFKMDQEIFLLISAHCSWPTDAFCTFPSEPSQFDYAAHSFSHAALVLRGNKDFMMQVVQNDVSLFPYASNDLKKDFDLNLLALAGLPPSGTFGFLNIHPKFRHDGAWFQKIQAGLETHKMFVQVVLCGMSLGGPHCSLGLLNQGAVTSEAYKKSIASYLGVPIDSQLLLYRQAFGNSSRAFPSDETLEDEARKLVKR